MNPDDPGRRNLIIEQWWCGLGVMLFWAVLIMLLAKSCS